MEPALEPATVQRLAAERAGQSQEVRLQVGNLEAGVVGVLDVEVRAIGPPRTYPRKRGGEGLLQRVTLADATGEVDLVLWDDELHFVREGPLQPGAQLRLHGPQVKAGFRGGLELGLQGAHLVASPQVEAREFVGQLLAIADTKPVGAPPALRFTCQLQILAAGTVIQCTAWDEAVKAALAAGVGARVTLRGRPNPFLEGWWTLESLRPAERNP